TLRLQQREDGVRIDQVVLSPSTYLATSPGTTKRDTTILPPNDGVLPNGSEFKVATWNIRSGDGRCPISGSCPFVDSTQNCTDPGQPLNAWGVGIPQSALSVVNEDSTLIALALQEAWACGQPTNVKNVLRWAYASTAYNGTALLTRYGIRGTLESKLVSAPTDEPAYILGADVCLDLTCAATLRVYVVHLTFFSLDDHVVDTVVLAQTQTMLAWIATQPHADRHVVVGDFNAFEREPAIDFRCELAFDYRTPQAMRSAGYTDAWLAVHGSAPGMTATLNRNGCGVTNGGPWKRIDYAYLKGLTPASSSFFAFESANTAAASDHYGLIASFSGSE
ncbi:MAG TPA: endonuclease/exonuclease/phosphatase family protein, partial [Vicinamibacterales bacterium]